MSKKILCLHICCKNYGSCTCKTFIFSHLSFLSSSPLTARLNCTTHGDCRIDIAEETLPEPKPFLIFTNQHNIQRINFDGTDYMQVANSDMMNLTALDYSPSEEMIYFVDGGRRVIERVGIDGRNRKVILSGLGIVNGIALDWLRGRLYWTDSE